MAIRSVVPGIIDVLSIVITSEVSVDGAGVAGEASAVGELDDALVEALAISPGKNSASI